MKTLPIEREIAKKLGIKVSQIMEWSTTPVKAQEGETLAEVDGIFVAYLKSK